MGSYYTTSNIRCKRTPCAERSFHSIQKCTKKRFIVKEPINIIETEYEWYFYDSMKWAVNSRRYFYCFPINVVLCCCLLVTATKTVCVIYILTIYIMTALPPPEITHAMWAVPLSLELWTTDCFWLNTLAFYRQAQLYYNFSSATMIILWVCEV